MNLWIPPQQNSLIAGNQIPLKSNTPPTSIGRAEIWKQEQEAIRRAGTQLSEIERAITAGEATGQLLDRCLRCIGDMAGDKSFYKRTQSKLNDSSRRDMAREVIDT